VRVLGIDPGSRHTGYGVVEASGTRLALVACGTVSPGDELPLAVRLACIHAELAEVIRRTQPLAVSVEEVFHAANARSALVLGHARGAALVAAAAASVDVHEYTAGEIKRAVTGNGRAEKEQVARMVTVLLGAGRAPGDEHACDAIAAAICHLNRARLAADAGPARQIAALPAVVPAAGGRVRAARGGASGFPAGVRIAPALRRGDVDPGDGRSEARPETGAGWRGGRRR